MHGRASYTVVSDASGEHGENLEHTSAAAGCVGGEDAALNPFGIVKDLPPGVFRRHGGLLVVMLGCGVVANVFLLQGAESGTQVTCALGEVVRRRLGLRYVLYDNACMLSRFVRTRARRRPGLSVLQDLASMRFVLDRFHAVNHTACRTPGHRLCMPEVLIDQCPALASLNTSWCESWNAWLDRHVEQARCMDAFALTVYAWLLADLWNTRVLVPGLEPSGHCEWVHASASLLKRRRTQSSRDLE